MARDLNNKNGTAAANGEQEVPGEPRPRAHAGLAGELAADAYNIVVALVFLALSYWLLFRNLPVEWFTLGLVASALIAVNVLVAVYGRY